MVCMYGAARILDWISRTELWIYIRSVVPYLPIIRRLGSIHALRKLSTWPESLLLMYYTCSYTCTGTFTYKRGNSPVRIYSLFILTASQNSYPTRRDRKSGSVLLQSLVDGGIAVEQLSIITKLKVLKIYSCKSLILAYLFRHASPV